jgi:hypothetical protein
MLRALLFLGVGALAGNFHNAAGQTPPPRLDTKTLHAVLAKGDGGPATTIFSKDTPKIETRWKGKGLSAGDRIRAIWIAEDVGSVAPKESKVTEAKVTVYKSDDDGAFVIGRPSEGWPVGKYRCQLYINDKLTETLRFIVEVGVTVEIGHE